jgi:head-tail adaptor
MKAGSLSNRVTIERLSATVNAAGQIDETSASNWVIYAERWCHVATRGSREFFRGVEVAADITHQITMRADPITKSITVKNRLVLDSRVLSISGPPMNVDELGQMIRFACVEVATDG